MVWVLSLHKFLDPITPSMRKVDGGERKKKKEEKKEKKREKNVVFSGLYVIASSQPPNDTAQTMTVGTSHTRGKNKDLLLKTARLSKQRFSLISLS